MKRPELAAILAEAVRDAGARVRYGLTVSALEEGGAGITAHLSDGSSGAYDLVVGADGIRSAVRRLIGVDVEPEPPHGDLADPHEPPEGRRAHRPDLRRAVLHRRVLPHRAGHDVRVPGREGTAARIH